MEARLISTHNTDNKFGYIFQEMHAVGDVFEVVLTATDNSESYYEDTSKDPWRYHPADLEIVKTPKPNASPILDKLKESRVVSFTISLDETEVYVDEMCDEAFSKTLTKAEFTQLITELTALKDQLKD